MTRGKIPSHGKVQKGLLSMERLRAFDSEPFAVLATEGREGPYVSLVACAFAEDGTTLLVATPRKSRKFRNLVINREVAVLIDRRPGKSQEALTDGEALSLTGAAVPVRRGEDRWEELCRVYLDKHPGLEEFLRSKSTALVAITVEEAVCVSRFEELFTWVSGKKGLKTKEGL
jgi:heme iron utilization protein